MASRAIASGTISFGLVSIPVKVYTATSSEKVSFNMLEAKTGSRLKQQYVSAASGQVVAREETIKGYEYARGQFVTLTADEVKALEADRTGAMEIAQFVPLQAVDMVQVEKSYYLGPDKGGDKAYKLLSQAMKRKDRVAVGRWQARGKEQLVLIRPYRGGLLLHQLFYSNEVRAYDEIDLGAQFQFPEVEMDLADRLIDQLSVESFEPDQYSDTYTTRVKALIDKKVAGQEIQLAPEQPKAQIIDLFEALKQSLDKGPKPAATIEMEALPVKKAGVRKVKVKKSKAG